MNGSDDELGSNSRPTSKPIAIPSGISLHFKRPIFPNLPYSPMSSPSNVRRRCPLKQSRHVSIEKTGQYVQLNQYLLKEPIGQVSVNHTSFSLSLKFELLCAQGSYGIVKLAYNEADDTHYVSAIQTKGVKVVCLDETLASGHENPLKEEIAAESGHIRSSGSAAEQDRQEREVHHASARPRSP